MAYDRSEFRAYIIFPGLTWIICHINFSKPVKYAQSRHQLETLSHPSGQLYRPVKTNKILRAIYFQILMLT